MGLFDGFPFKTKDQIEKERADFSAKVFPLGPEQKEAASNILGQIISRKTKTQQALFAFIAGKDYCLSLVEKDGHIDTVVLRRFLTKQHIGLPPEDQALVAALILLDFDVTRLDEYPAADIVRQKALEL